MKNKKASNKHNNRKKPDKQNKPRKTPDRDKSAERAAKLALREKRRKEIERIKKENATIAAERKKARDEAQKKLYEEKEKLYRERLKRRNALYAKIKRVFSNRADGFGYRNDGVLPRVIIRFRGDRTSAAARFAAAGIVVSDMHGVGGETAVKIRKKDFHKAIAILNELCYNYEIDGRQGVGRTLGFLAARIGLAVGAVISAATLAVVYGYVWRVEIDGNDMLSAAAIISALDKAGIRAGCKKAGTVCAQAARALGEMDGIADASCEIVGTTLYVRVLEAVDFTESKPATAFASEYDAVVTRVVTRSGTSLVKRGDVVKCGQQLANGDVFSTAGELLYTGECDADVFGNVSVTFVAHLPKVTVEYRPTGKSSSCTVLSLFGFKLGKAKSPYRSYQMTAQTANYDVLLPLYVTSYEYLETKAVEVERDPDEAVKSFAEQKIEQMRFEGEFDCSYNVTDAGSDSYEVHLFLSGETLISRATDRSDFSPDALLTEK